MICCLSPFDFFLFNQFFNIYIYINSVDGIRKAKSESNVVFKKKKLFISEIYIYSINIRN